MEQNEHFVLDWESGSGYLVLVNVPETVFVKGVITIS